MLRGVSSASIVLLVGLVSHRYKAMLDRTIVCMVLLATLSCSSTSSLDGALDAAMWLVSNCKQIMSLNLRPPNIMSSVIGFDVEVERRFY